MRRWNLGRRLLPVMLGLALLALVWGVLLVTINESLIAAEHKALIHQNKELILQNHESIRHLQSRVNFLDHALGAVCKEAGLPCPAPFPSVSPTPTQ